MSVSAVSTISSLSPEWIAAVKSSGRFGPEYNWDRKVTVPITTLDELIRLNGRPAFIKIDVEGFEPEVVAGLSSPVKSLSFEFTPEAANRAAAVLDHLSALGPFRANFARGEDLHFVLPEWVDREALDRYLKTYENDHASFGDVYVRFPGVSA